MRIVGSDGVALTSGPQVCGSHIVAAKHQTPGYLFGAVGEVTSLVGAFADPERQAFFSLNTDVPKRPLYIVTFSASALWADGQVARCRTQIENSQTFSLKVYFCRFQALNIV